MAATEHTEASILALIRDRYAAPEWATFTSVRSQTGFGSRKIRTADALALNLWKSRGHELWGFEVKVSTGDLRREIADPSKADEIARHCRRWWIVGPRAVADSAILTAPPAWGVIEAQASRLVVRRESGELAAEPASVEFVAALCRRLHESQPAEAEIARRVEEGVQAGVQGAEQRIAERLEERDREARTAQKRLREICVALGTWAPDYDGGVTELADVICAAVRLVGRPDRRAALSTNLNVLAGQLDRVQEVLNALKAERAKLESAASVIAAGDA